MTLYSGEIISTANTSLVITEATNLISEDGRVVTLILGDDVANRLKADMRIATNDSNTYLSIPEGAIQDLSGNDFNGTTIGVAVMVTDFTNDTNSPSLTTFVLDVNSGWLNLTFNETILASSINTSIFTIQNRRRQTVLAESHQLMSSTTSTTDSPEIQMI